MGSLAQGKEMGAIPVNWWAVLVAALLRFLVGFVWYSPVAFVKPWQAVAGLTPAGMQQGMPRAIAIEISMSLLMAFALANIIGASGITDWFNGALAGLWLWAGFVVATHLPLWGFENRPFKLIAINLGCHLVSLLAMGALLGAWR